jgi:CheY-like chemotaxis protein
MAIQQQETALVVDDDEIFRRLMVTRLRFVGYDVVDVESVDAALLVLELRPVDLIVSDYRMPVHDGLELLRKVRLRFPAIPFVVMSGDLDPEVREQVAAFDRTAALEKGDALDALRLGRLAIG